MAVTRLKRKGRRNKVVAKAKVKRIQRLNASPVIKQVDVEKIKEEFAAAIKRKMVEQKEEPKAKAVEAEVKEAKPKKEAPKKETSGTAKGKPTAKKTADKKPVAKKAAPKEKKEDKK